MWEIMGEARVEMARFATQTTGTTGARTGQVQGELHGTGAHHGRRLGLGGGRHHRVDPPPPEGAHDHRGDDDADDDGSGDMEMRRNAAGMDNRVPQWTLFSW